MMGAALGGGIAALQKKDVLQGALMGGVGGALGGAFMPAAGGIAGATEATASSLLPTAGAETTSALLANPQGMFTGAAGSGAGVTGITAPTATSLAGMGGGTGIVAPQTASLGFSGVAPVASSPFSIGNFLSQNKYALAGGALGGMMAPGQEPDKPDEGNIRDYTFNREVNSAFGQPGQPYFNDSYTAGAVTPVEDYNKANGGIIALAEGGDTGYQSLRLDPITAAQANRYGSNARTIAPEVAAYNDTLMQRANQQYNINPAPAPMQVPGSAGYGAYTPLPTVSSPSNAGIGGLGYDPVTRRYTGTFETPGSKKTELEKMREEMEAMRGFMPNQDTGGAANGGLMRYAMGGGIGARYPSPDDGAIMDTSGMIGASPTVNMAPHYPMQNTGTAYAGGGHLGDYSDGGRLLKGPGDGIEDQIPAVIGSRQPARLANNEFVLPARIVSEIGNGSTDAGAKRLYEMMDRVQKRRSKTTGKGNIAVDSGAHKELNRL
jgi:hypothetical protein